MEWPHIFSILALQKGLNLHAAFEGASSLDCPKFKCIHIHSKKVIPIKDILIDDAQIIQDFLKY